jgi:flagellar biosynthetic protein FliQ
MTLELVAAVSRDALMTAWQVSYPTLMAGLVVGLLISIFQAVTQIHEMTLTFIPKILAAVVAVALTYDKMMQVMLDFTRRMFTEWEMFLHCCRCLRCRWEPSSCSCWCTCGCSACCSTCRCSVRARSR